MIWHSPLESRNASAFNLEYAGNHVAFGWAHDPCHTTTQRSKKGSEKGSGKSFGEGFSEGF